MRVAGTRVIAVEVDRGFVEGLNRCGEVREKVVKDVSNIFGLSNRKNKAALLLQGQNDSSSRVEAEDTRRLVLGRRGYAVCQTFNGCVK